MEPRFDAHRPPPYTDFSMGSRSGVKSYNVNFNFYITPGVQALLLANFGVWFFQILLRYFAGHHAHDQLLLWFGLVPSAVVPGLRIWQPLTYLFLHDPDTIWHIVLNMFTLWMFGRELELVWGINRFLRYYFLTGVGAGIINVVVKTVPSFFGHGFSDVPTIGASGAIFGVLIACAILFPDREVYFLPIPVKLRMRTVVTVMVVLTFLGTFGLGDDRVSHLCHLGGLVVGYVYLRRDSFLYRVRNEVSDWKYQRNRKRFEVFMGKQKDEPPSRPDRWVN
jgi:membrane associated rhomboid family serine protease